MRGDQVSIEESEVLVAKTAVDKRLLTEEETARYIGTSRSFLRRARMEGDRLRRTPAPPHIKFGRCVRYDVEDLNRWIDHHRQDTGPGVDA